MNVDKMITWTIFEQLVRWKTIASKNGATVHTIEQMQTSTHVHSGFFKFKQLSAAWLNNS